MLHAKSEVDGDSVWAWRFETTYLLSEVFSFPTVEFAEAISSGDWVSRAKDVLERAHHPNQSGAASQLEEALVGLEHVQGNESAVSTLERLRRAYTSLYLGIDTVKVGKSESAYTGAEDGRPLAFVNPVTMEVETFFRECGVVGGKGSSNDPLDTIEAELEFLAYCAGVEASLFEPSAPTIDHGDCYSTFLWDHLDRWVGDFITRTRESTEEQVYIVATDLLSLFIDVERTLSDRR